LTALAELSFVLPLTRIQRERILLKRGKVLANQGQKVSPRDVIAKANLAPEYVILNIVHDLGLSVAKVDRYIICKEGDTVNADDVIAAGPKGFFRRIVHSPCDGRIVLVGDGQVLIEQENTPQPLYAGYPGIVVNLIPDRGAVVEAIGALVQGVWGNGLINFGVLRVLVDQAVDLLTPELLDFSMRGAVILGGHCNQVEALQSASEIKIRGLILGSMSTALVPAALGMPFPIVLTEGFGHLPMNAAAFELLTSNANRDTTVNAEPFDRYSGTRPEIVVALVTSDQPPLPTLYQLYTPGQRVRIICNPHMTRVGTIVRLSGLQRVSSAIRTQTADIQLEGDKLVTIPLANLNLLE
jgi:hypothetical protein